MVLVFVKLWSKIATRNQVHHLEGNAIRAGLVTFAFAPFYDIIQQKDTGV